MSEDINIGVITEALNNKVDLPNPTVPQDAVDYVVEMQRPTAENNYTWYRKYKSGWVEQGGYIAANGTTYDNYAITLPVLMADTHYFKQKLFHKGRGDSSGFSWAWLADHNSSGPDDTTSVAYFCIPANSYVLGLYWQVSGMAE